MTDSYTVVQAGHRLGQSSVQAWNLVSRGVWESQEGDGGVHTVNLEDCRWALYWYNYFLNSFGTAKSSHNKAMIASALLIEYRAYIRHTGGKFFHEFRYRKPSLLSYIWSALCGLFAGVGASFLFIMFVQFLLKN